MRKNCLKEYKISIIDQRTGKPDECRVYGREVRLYCVDAGWRFFLARTPSCIRNAKKWAVYELYTGQPVCDGDDEIDALNNANIVLKFHGDVWLAQEIDAQLREHGILNGEYFEIRDQVEKFINDRASELQ